MTRPQYAVRQTWEAFKAAALAADEAPVEAVALAAIEKWASHEAGSAGGPRRDLREALATSLSGAFLVDAAVEKLAAQGRYTREEAEFLLDLNAEAALGDLSSLLKVSSALDWIKSHPTTVGAGVGLGVGAGIGAMKDEDSRARGALLYGVPGAVIGGLAGHGVGTWRDLAQKEQAKRLADEAAAAAENTHATHEWNYKLHQGREWGKAQDAAHALQAGAPAAEKAKALEDARRWHQNLFEAADMFTRNSDRATQEYARHLKHQIHSYKDSIIEHASDNPQAVHKVLIQAAGVDGGQKALNAILAHARMLHKNGN